MGVIKIENLGVKFQLQHRRRRRIRERLLSPFFQGNRAEEFWALKGVSFEVKEGDIVGVIGKNGAGKSTLLRVLAGVFQPDIGTVEVYGKVSPLLSLGVGFRPDLTGKDNVYLNGILLGLSEREIDAKYDFIVKFAELEKFIDIPMRNYSSGMNARLGFSIAVSIEPDILLIDEILGAGDEKFRKKSQQRMKQFMEKAKAIVIVTHNMRFVREFCNKGILLDAGEIRSLGDAEKVVKAYINSC